MAAISPIQKKAINKVTEVMQDYPLGIEFGELMQKTQYKKTSLYNALSLAGASKSADGLWHLPHSKTTKPAHEVTDDDLNDIQTSIDEPVKDTGFIASNAQTPQVSSPVNEEFHHDTDADLDTGECAYDIKFTNPNTGREYVELPETGASIKQVIEAVAESQDEEEFELTSPVIKQPSFILIENCYLSLAQDGTGQEPALATDSWFDDEGEEVEECDCKILNRARESHTNEIEFRGVTYRNLFVADAQLFHGTFDSIESAHARMAELMAKKPSNIFEVLEV